MADNTNGPIPRSGFTQSGGTEINRSEGPLRVGLIPRKVTFPFNAPPFYLSSRRSVSRDPQPRGMGNNIRVLVRAKREELGWGMGVMDIFSVEQSRQAGPLRRSN